MAEHDRTPDPMRRLLLQAGGLGLLAGCANGPPIPENLAPPVEKRYIPSTEGETLLRDLEERCFRYFWETTNPVNGLVPDRWPSPSACSIAAVGFALTAYPIGVMRGWITRAQARERTRTTLRFFHDAPQGPAARGMAGYKGFYYHFLDMHTGARDTSFELSTVDTALLMMGVLYAQAWFDGADPVEAEIRQLADTLYARIDWRWAQNGTGGLSLGWMPESGFLVYNWAGYNEAMMLYLLALGSPTADLALGSEAWSFWTRTYLPSGWGSSYGEPHLQFPPMFGHQYSHVWVDFRGIRDEFMRSKGIDYFENSRRATYSQRAYAAANPGRWRDYSANIWGITACDGPAPFELDVDGRRRRFYAYAGRGMGGDATYDDGTLAPTAACGSIAFAPEIVVPALLAMKRKYGDNLYQRYGFLDAFNPTFDTDTPPKYGRQVRGLGWFDTDYIGIDLGPMVTMIANYRSEAVWAPMRRSPWLRRGLLRAGFKGGWLAE